MLRKTFTFCLIFTCLFILQANARVWRINNIPGVHKDFADPAAAIASSSVVHGDTLYVEGSSISYGSFNLTKRLVIIGTGYFLNGTNSNPGLQANPNPSSFGNTYIIFDSTGSGSVLMGLSAFFMGASQNLGSATDNITITKCQVNSVGIFYGYITGTVMNGWKINKCYITGQVGDGSLVMQNWDVSNNIIVSSINLSNAGNLNNIVRNNIINSTITLNQAYFANNVIYSTFNVINVTVKNNLGIGNPVGFGTYAGINGNVNNLTEATIFLGLTGNSTDGQYRLKAGSPAIGAGLTVGTVVTPDCGAFGGPDPYILSGIPNIPTIYALTVPASVPTGTPSMNVTFSTRNNK